MEKYKSVLNANIKETVRKIILIHCLMNGAGIPNDYLSNEQQCQNLYNNMTRAKSLYGKPFVK